MTATMMPHACNVVGELPSLPRGGCVVMAEIIGTVAAVWALSEFAVKTLRTIRRVQNPSREIEDFQVGPEREGAG